MPRYIDLEKALERLRASPAFEIVGTDGFFLFNVVSDLLVEQPTADVVPRSEYEQLKLNHKSRVDRLINECGNQSTIWRLHFAKIYENHKKTIKQELAREIFADIGKILEKYYLMAQRVESDELLEVATDYISYVSYDIAEFQEKYIGGKK